MAGFSEILGHEQIIEHLQKAVQMAKTLKKKEMR